MRVYLTFFTLIIILCGCNSTTELNNNHKRQSELEARKKHELELVSSFDTLSPTKFTSRCHFHDPKAIDGKNHNLFFTRPLNYLVPSLARKYKVKGYVKLEYDVDSKGKPINIGVYEHFPNSVFDKKAILTLKIAQMDVSRDSGNLDKDEVEQELSHSMYTMVAKLNKSAPIIEIDPVNCLKIELAYDES